MAPEHQRIHIQRTLTSMRHFIRMDGGTLQMYVNLSNGLATFIFKYFFQLPHLINFRTAKNTCTKLDSGFHNDMDGS